MVIRRGIEKFCFFQGSHLVVNMLHTENNVGFDSFTFLILTDVLSNANREIQLVSRYQR